MATYTRSQDDTVTAADSVATTEDFALGATTPSDGAGIPDDITVEDVGGDAIWTGPLSAGTGYNLPGSSDQSGAADDTETPELVGQSTQERWIEPLQQAGALEQDPGAGGADTIETPELVGPTTQERWIEPLQQAGTVEEDPSSGVPDQVEAALSSTPDYIDGINDSDGRAFIIGTQIQQVISYDATADPWHGPHSPGSGFHGIGRDGVNYWDGNPCGPADFGTLANGFDHTAWISDQEPMGLWSWVTAATMTMISGDKVRASGTFNAWGGKGLRSAWKWYLTGDFDIEVSYENFSSAGGSDGGFLFLAAIDFDNYIYVRRRNPGSSRYDSDVRNNASWGNYVSVGTSDTSGKLRLVRSGSTVSAYYWDNISSWVLLRSGISLAAGAQPMLVGVEMNGDGSMTGSVDFWNFQINSGAAANTSGWSRETAGTHRGVGASFPTQSDIVLTDESLNIIDTTTNKLWMRFTRGNNMALHNGNGTTPTRMAVDDGVILVSSAVPNFTADDGHTTVIDFNLDNIQWHREDGSSVTGGILRALNGGTLAPVGYWPRENAAIGIIPSRNGGYGWGSDYTDWRIPDYRVLDTALLHSGTYQYRAHATYAGVAAHAWERRYMDGSVTTGSNLAGILSGTGETGTMWWCHFDPSNDRLFYMSASTVYSANSATWKAGLTDAGSTWVANNSEVLPGTYTDRYQYTGVVHSGDLYVPANEGVYKHAAWPAGSLTLFYGKPGSGATHEILPEYDLITSISLASDAGVDLLVCGLRWDGGAYIGPSVPLPAQIVVVRLDTNVIWAKQALSSAVEGPRSLA